MKAQQILYPITDLQQGGPLGWVASYIIEFKEIGNSDPTTIEEQYDSFQNAYNYFSEYLFGNALPAAIQPKNQRTGIKRNMDSQNVQLLSGRKPNHDLECKKCKATLVAIFKSKTKNKILWKT